MKPEGYGAARQQRRRQLESQTRRRAVDFRDRQRKLGVSAGAIAKLLKLSFRTLSQWGFLSKLGRLRPRLRGRPSCRLSARRRNEVIGFLRGVGPAIGLERLRAQVPEATRGALRDILGRFRRVYLKRNGLLIHELSWKRPGTVWAMDHAEAPSLIDGIYPAVFSVRDLASGEQLLWEPCYGMTAAETVDHLECLLTERGVPLLFKSDNGPAFTSEAMARLADRFGFLQLLSPAEMPEYNGSAEAGIGAMKRRTNYQAAMSGRVGHWQSEDLERAQSIANALYMARQDEAPVSAACRHAFRREVDERELRLRKEMSFECAAGHEIMTAGVARRRAITGALVAQEFLTIRRRRVSLPLKSIFCAKIP